MYILLYVYWFRDKFSTKPAKVPICKNAKKMGNQSYNFNQNLLPVPENTKDKIHDIVFCRQY